MFDALTCFHQGWCGTCVEGAKPGEAGHCHEGILQVLSTTDRYLFYLQCPSPKSLSESARPSPTLGWGWCGRNCFVHHHNGAADVLRVAEVEVGRVRVEGKQSPAALMRWAVFRIADCQRQELQEIDGGTKL